MARIGEQIEEREIVPREEPFEPATPVPEPAPEPVTPTPA
jgi:hypothetical protein